jgi:hypothetical protein
VISKEKKKTRKQKRNKKQTRTGRWAKYTPQGQATANFLGVGSYALARNTRNTRLAEIERLEKARRECTDYGLQKRIEAWDRRTKGKLMSQDSSPR